MLKFKSLCCIVNPAQCAKDDIENDETYIRCSNVLDECLDHLDLSAKGFRGYWCENCCLREAIEVERRHDIAKDRGSHGM